MKLSSAIVNFSSFWIFFAILLTRNWCGVTYTQVTVHVHGSLVLNMSL